MILIVCYCFRCDSRIAAYVPQCQYMFCILSAAVFLWTPYQKTLSFCDLLFSDSTGPFLFLFHSKSKHFLAGQRKKKNLKQNKKTLDNEQSWDVRNYAVLIQRSGLFSARLWSECLVYSSFTCILFLSSLEKSYGEQGKWWMLVAMLS